MVQILTRQPPASFNDEALREITSPLLRRLYAARGVSDPDEVESGLQRLLPPDLMPDVNKAAQRLADAITTGQKIVVVGDFDADGTVTFDDFLAFASNFGKSNKSFL